MNNSSNGEKNLLKFAIKLNNKGTINNLEEKCSEITKLSREKFILAEVVNSRVSRLLNIQSKSIILKDLFQLETNEIYMYEVQETSSLSSKLSLRNNSEILVGAEVSVYYNNKIRVGVVNNISDKKENGIVRKNYSIDLGGNTIINFKREEIKNYDSRVENFYLCEIYHALPKRRVNAPDYSAFGTPIIISISDKVSYSMLREQIINQAYNFISSTLELSHQRNDYQTESNKSISMKRNNEYAKKINDPILKKSFSIKILDSQNGRCIFCKNKIYRIDSVTSMSGICKCEIPSKETLIRYLFRSEADNINVCLVWSDSSAYHELETTDHESIKSIFNNNSSLQTSFKLTDCFDLYIKEDRVENYKCESCKKIVKVLIQYKLSQLPEILIIYFKRFRYIRNSIEKISTPINFPLKELNIKKYSIDETDKLYDLISVINHYPIYTGGHYKANIYIDEINSWFEFDDEKAKAITSSEIIEPEAYVLFYKNKNLKGSNLVNSQL